MTFVPQHSLVKESGDKRLLPGLRMKWSDTLQRNGNETSLHQQRSNTYNLTYRQTSSCGTDPTITNEGDTTA